MRLEIASAIVTPRGIHFQNIYYSCPTAIKGRWFELAWVNGSWEISILYDPESTLETILIDGPPNGEREVCNSIRKEDLSGQKLERYFSSIQQLKKRRRKRVKVRGME